MPERFSVDNIDHVEVHVPDVPKAAEWYDRVLGLEKVPGIDWAIPTMISADGGKTKIALFEGSPQAADVGWRRVAFRVSAAAFFAFLDGLEEIAVLDHDGRQVKATDVVDHDISWSIYFTDPYGNRLEITTYDHEEVETGLPR